MTLLTGEEEPIQVEEARKSTPDMITEITNTNTSRRTGRGTPRRKCSI